MKRRLVFGGCVYVRTIALQQVAYLELESKENKSNIRGKFILKNNLKDSGFLGNGYQRLRRL